MPRKRTEIKLIEMNKPDSTALPLEIGLNLPCVKGEMENVSPSESPCLSSDGETTQTTAENKQQKST